MKSNYSEIREKGIRALIDALGTTGAVNFMRQLETGSGNYTEDRKAMFKDETMDTIAERIKTRNNHI